MECPRKIYFFGEPFSRQIDINRVYIWPSSNRKETIWLSVLYRKLESPLTMTLSYANFLYHKMSKNASLVISKEGNYTWTHTKIAIRCRWSVDCAHVNLFGPSTDPLQRGASDLKRCLWRFLRVNATCLVPRLILQKGWWHLLGQSYYKGISFDLSSNSKISPYKPFIIRYEKNQHIWFRRTFQFYGV